MYICMYMYICIYIYKMVVPVRRFGNYLMPSAVGYYYRHTNNNEILYIYCVYIDRYRYI
jgi:hypothetical protein